MQNYGFQLRQGSQSMHLTSLILFNGQAYIYKTLDLESETWQCYWIYLWGRCTGTKGANTDTENSMSHPEVSSFPVAGNVSEKKRIFCMQFKGHTSQRISFFYFLNRSRADFRLASAAAFSFRCFRSASIFTRSSTVFLMISCWCGGKKKQHPKIRNGLAKTPQRKINYQQTLKYILSLGSVFPSFLFEPFTVSNQHCVCTQLLFFFSVMRNSTLTLWSSWATCFLRLSTLPAELRPFFLCLGTNFSLARGS